MNVNDFKSTPDRLRLLVQDHAHDLVQRFYDTLLQNEEARKFLDHTVVQQRLSRSLHTWLLDLMEPASPLEDQAFADRQIRIGEVHARIKIPMHLVMAGASVLKARLADILEGDEDGFRHYLLIDTRMDAALRLMSQSYVKGTMTRARLDEAYRLFSLDQDINLERESQRASLMEWGQKTLFRILGNRASDGRAAMSSSPFGLWIRHRAGFLFESSPHLETLTLLMERIDKVLLPQLEPKADGDRDAALVALQAAVEEAAYLLNEMFKVLGDMEGGRDPLTRALNRRFLPSILSREIGISNAEKSPLSVLLLDVDHFKSVNDTRGHQIGDEVLRQVAQVISDNVRPSDFVFRYGGEEFLVVLVETSVQQALIIAERVRAALEIREMKAGGDDVFHVTASIGVAEHLGHPDEHYLIKAADKALYQAKKTGRNRVIRAS